MKLPQTIIEKYASNLDFNKLVNIIHKEYLNANLPNDELYDAFAITELLLHGGITKYNKSSELI
jgi:hypothetical protein